MASRNPILALLLFVLVAWVLVFSRDSWVRAGVAAVNGWQRRDLPYHGAPTPFDSTVWRAAEPGLRSPRLDMLEDLVGSGILLGRTKPELEALLGDGDRGASTPNWWTQNRLREWDHRFNAGARNTSSGVFDPYLTDYSYLVVRFGEDGRVIESAVVDDR